MKHNVLNVNNIRATLFSPCRVITRAIFRGEKRADIAAVAHTERGRPRTVAHSSILQTRNCKS